MNDFIQKFKEIWVFVLPFLIFLPISLSTDFMQNDDWVHYKTVERFLAGNFTLEPIIGSTFYTQGILGFVFATFFGIFSLPILTAIISYFNFYILYLILRKYFLLKIFPSFLLSLLLLLNPLYFYSSIGFMTENYFIFFLLLSCYFVFDFFKKQNIKIFLILNFFAIAGFFVKQSFLIFFVSLIIYFLIKKFYKYFLLEAGILSILAIFYYLFFPLTEVMKRQSVNFVNLFSFQNNIIFLLIIAIYTVSMLLPIFVFYIVKNLKTLNRREFIYVFSISVVVYLMLEVFFTKSEIFSNVFPYLTNTFDRKGFYPYGLSGNKYHWKGFYDIFEYWTLSSKLILAIFISLLLFRLKKLKSIKLSFPLIFSLAYIFALMLSVNTIYDRYLLPLFPMIILVVTPYLKENIGKYSSMFIVSFLIFLGFINYAYSMDYINWQNYVWEKSSKLEKILDVVGDSDNPGIRSSHAWNGYYGSSSNPKYFFTFDSPEVLSNPEYNLIETHIVDFPFNPFINSNIYLYKLK